MTAPIDTATYIAGSQLEIPITFINTSTGQPVVPASARYTLTDGDGAVVGGLKDVAAATPVPNPWSIEIGLNIPAPGKEVETFTLLVEAEDDTGRLYRLDRAYQFRQPLADQE